jgi:hypothetical protein
VMARGSAFAELEAQYTRAPSERKAKQLRAKARAAAGKFGIAPPLWARVTKSRSIKHAHT